MPINMNPADVIKLVEIVDTVLNKARAEGKTRVFVNTRDFFESAKFSHLRYARFADEMGDLMTCTPNVYTHGEWIFTEFGDGFSVFAQLTAPGEPSGIDSHMLREDTLFVQTPNRQGRLAKNANV